MDYVLIAKILSMIPETNPKKRKILHNKLTNINPIKAKYLPKLSDKVNLLLLCQMRIHYQIQNKII